MVPCLVTLTDLLTRRAGLSASAELLVWQWHSNFDNLAVLAYFPGITAIVNKTEFVLTTSPFNFKQIFVKQFANKKGANLTPFGIYND